MQNLGRKLRLTDMEQALQFASVNDHEAGLQVLNEVEDALALERKRMGFMVYYGRFMCMDDRSNYWMARTDGHFKWKTNEFRSPQEAIDAGMIITKWSDL
jgi:SAM-dependent MidA family methyltransferase